MNGMKTAFSQSKSTTLHSQENKKANFQLWNVAPQYDIAVHWSSWTHILSLEIMQSDWMLETYNLWSGTMTMTDTSEKCVHKIRKALAINQVSMQGCTEYG